MARYTKKDKDGRYYIEGINGKLESNMFGHTYGEAIDRFAQLENADVVPRDEVAKIFEEIEINIFKLETPYQTLHCISSGFIEKLKEKYTKGGEQK